MAAYNFQEDSGKLVFELKNSRPLELADLTKSLTAVANQYRRFVIREELHEESEAKLYVKEVRDGSTIFELFSYVQTHVGDITTAIETSKAIIGFGAYLRDSYDEIRNGKKPENLPVKDIRDLADILEPTAKDQNGQISIHADRGATVQITINLSHDDANIIQNRASRLVAEMQETNQLKFTKRGFYWDTTSKGDPRSSDKGVIESIEHGPVHVIFEDSALKEMMVIGKAHPFLTTYIVDVELITSKGKTKAYKILALHDIIEDNDD